jgi:hypothetical protein
MAPDLSKADSAELPINLQSKKKITFKDENIRLRPLKLPPVFQN